MTRKFENDPINDLYDQVANLKKQLNGIQRQNRLTLPIRKVSNLPSGVEGEMVVADATAATNFSDKSVFIFVDGQWWEARSVSGVVVPVGPALYSAGVEIAYGDSFINEVWQVGMNDGSGEVIVGGNDGAFHMASPVWNWTIDRILYQELKKNIGDEHFPAISLKLCLMDRDGSNRVVVHDTGDTSSSIYYYSYSVSPDGQKVAFITPSPEGYMKVAAADGSGVIATLDTNPYGTPNWSADSQYVFYQNNDGSVTKRIFDGSAAQIVVRADLDMDYFWSSPDFTKFASLWYGGTDGTHIIVDATTGVIIYSAEQPDYSAWSGKQPIEVFWLQDGRIVLSRQQTNSNPFHDKATAVIVDPTDLSSYVICKMEDGSGFVESPTGNPPYSSGSAVQNWAPILVDGVEKLGVTARYRNPDPDFGSNYGIAYFDTDTGVGHWLSNANWDGDTPGQIFNRYSLTGTPIGTWFFGAQVWDI